MIASTKNCTKKQKQNQKWIGRTLGQMVKAELYKQNHTKKHTHTHLQKEKKENIYILKKKRKRGNKSINKPTSDNKL